MKKIYIVAILVLSLAQMECKNPLQGIQLYVRNDFFSYSVNVSVKDAVNSGISLNNAVVTVSGPIADYLYDRDGKKAFKVDSGMVSFNLYGYNGPAPTDDNPLYFNVSISVPNSSYIPVTKIIQIRPEQLSQHYTIRMLDTTSGGDIGVENRTISMSNGGTSRPVYTGTRTTSYSDTSLDALGTSVSLYIPTGTTFYYYKDKSGNPVGTQASILTHDSTVTVGATAALYRSITNYYTIEKAIFPSTSYDSTTYVQPSFATSITAYLLYEPITAPSYSIYPYGTLSNTISSLSGSVQENSTVFSSAASKRLVAVYFVAQMADRSLITVSPCRRTPSYSGGVDTNNWFLSYRINTSAINPRTHALYRAGDSVETGIIYTAGSYPSGTPGTAFTPTTLKTSRTALRLTSRGVLRAECQSMDAGIYQRGINTTYSFSINTGNDTNIIPDLENYYGNVTLNFSTGSGTSSYYYNTGVYPSNTPATTNISGSVTFLGVSAPVITGSYQLYYWDTAFYSGTLISGGTVNSIFKKPSIGSFNLLSYPYSEITRFYFTMTCPATGTSKIIEPTLNGTSTVTTGGRNKLINCNVKNGYWATRGFLWGTPTFQIVGAVCNNTVHIKPPYDTLSKFNYGKVINDTICKCYFK